MVSSDTTPLPASSEPVTNTDFGNRLAAARKQSGLTQQALADCLRRSRLPAPPLRSRHHQPTLDVLRNLAARAEHQHRLAPVRPRRTRPRNTHLRLRLEALDQLDPDEQANVLAMIEGALLATKSANSTSADSAREFGQPLIGDLCPTSEFGFVHATDLSTQNRISTEVIDISKEPVEHVEDLRRP